MKYIILAVLISLVLQTVSGQSREKIKYKADDPLEVFTLNGEKVFKLKKNVVFKQKETTVYCDSSFYYRQQNIMRAFGHVHIVDDSTDIKSKRLIYDGTGRLARLRENVRYVRGTRRLFTDSLDYQLDTDVAKYFSGGRLVDTTNTLKSRIGYFYAKDNKAIFYHDVILESPDFTLKTDTLRYNTLTKIAYTDGPTKIINEDGTQLFSNGGVFRTYIDQSQFIEGNVETADYYLEGDELFFDDLNKYYKSEGNVVLTAKEKDIIITGDEGYYDRKNGISKIYGSPVMKRILEQDTFFLSADTLIAIESEFDSAKRIQAFYDVKIFKSNLQGLCDSMAYFLSDSLIFLYDDPILWTQKNQIEGDTIILEVTENKLEKMELHRNSFMISQDTMKNFNQVKGREMYAYFDSTSLRNIEVIGNGESIFYSLDKGDTSILGMNRLLCSRMNIRFKNGDIDNISIYTQPEGKFIPPHELTEDVQRLDRFDWRSEKRPALKDIYAKRLPPGIRRKKEPEEGETTESDREENTESREGGERKSLKNPKSTLKMQGGEGE